MTASSITAKFVGGPFHGNMRMLEDRDSERLEVIETRGVESTIIRSEYVRVKERKVPPDDDLAERFEKMLTYLWEENRIDSTTYDLFQEVMGVLDPNDPQWPKQFVYQEGE